MTAIRLIVGLGNPGPRYEDTRHNAGQWFVDELARAWNADLRADARQHADLGKVTAGGRDVWLMKPHAYMNESGGSVGRVMRYYRVPLDAMLVAYDELDLPVGDVRLREGGGHGGHNGMRDITTHCGGSGFPRLRLGIGRPTDRDEVVNWVLSRPRREERRLIDDAIDDAVRAMDDFVAGNRQPAIKSLHSRAKSC